MYDDTPHRRKGITYMKDNPSVCSIRVQRQEKQFLQRISQISKPSILKWDGNAFHQFSLRKVISVGVYNYCYNEHLLPGCKTMYEEKCLVLGLIKNGCEDTINQLVGLKVDENVQPFLQGLSTRTNHEGLHLTIDGVGISDEVISNNSLSKVALGMFLTYLLSLSVRKPGSVIYLSNQECKRKLPPDDLLTARLWIVPLSELSVLLEGDSCTILGGNYYDFYFSSKGIFCSSGGKGRCLLPFKETPIAEEEHDR